MTARNTATITASLERSLRNFSLNGSGGRAANGGAGFGRSSSSDDVSETQLDNQDASLELNSHISLPYDWEQRLNLKTGEIYYVNWRTGKKSNEDPRIIATTSHSGPYNYSDDNEDDISNHDSEESSSVSSLASYSSSTAWEPPQVTASKDRVLVVGGCKTCLMYYMVPKEVRDCPKCSGQLLHFERSEDGSL